MGVIIASREGLLHRIMFSAFTSRTAARVVGRRGISKIPRRQPSRQMDDKGRATLGRHLFNRENSITEYWVSLAGSQNESNEFQDLFPCPGFHGPRAGQSGRGGRDGGARRAAEETCSFQVE